MIKVYCDICKKEITMFKEQYNIDVQNINFQRPSINRKVYFNVCKPCTEKVLNFIDEQIIEGE